MGRHGVLGALAGLGALTALAAACAGDPADPDPSRDRSAVATLEAGAFDDVAVTVFRNRADDLRGVFTVKVDNTAGVGDLAVESVGLTTAAYSTEGPVATATTVAAGLRVDLRVPVGAPVCGDGADAAAATVDLVLGRPDDPARTTVTREVDARDLQRWNARECAVAEVAALAAPAFTGPWRPVTTPEGRLVSEGTLRLAVPPDAPADVTLQAVERTVILTPLALPLPVTVAPGGTLELPVRLASGRCDPHAVADQKYGFVFPVRLAVGAAEAVPVPVTVPEADRTPLFDMIVASCGLGGTATPS